MLSLALLRIVWLFVGWLPTLLCVLAERALGVRMPWWMDTPDDAESPRGMSEPRVRRIHRRFGPVASDWYWLAWRNPLFGLAYARKPARYKGLKSYRGLEAKQWYEGSTRVTVVDGMVERIYKLGPIGILTGHRVGPVFGSIQNVPDRVIANPNMDFRPILSVRPYRRAVDDGGSPGTPGVSGPVRLSEA